MLRKTRHINLCSQAIKTRLGCKATFKMADEEANTNENIEPKQKDFYGFALYTYNARRYARLVFHSCFFILLIIGLFRPRSAEVEENKNGQDSEDGAVSSKIVAEGSVSDFLRKEATTNYDFR